MSQLTITPQDILQQVKFSGKVPEMVEAVLTRQVITQAATELAIQNTTDELQAMADQFRLSNQLNSAKETQLWFNKNGFSLDDFEEMINYQLLSIKLGQHLFKDQVKDYFIQHQLDYQRVVMYEVVLEDKDLAIELYLAIKAEEISFFEVAHKYNKDDELRRKGGYQGILYRKDLKPEISAAVFAAQAPELLKPIVTSKNVHLIFVEEIIKPQLEQKTQSLIFTNLFSQWLKSRVELVDFKLDLDVLK